MKSFIRCLILIGSLVATDSFAATFSVTTTNVTGPGSLQQAIFDANTNASVDTITFNIVSSGLTISPTNALPAITEAVTIDGSTQPGFAGAPIIELNGLSAGAGGVDGLRITTGNCTIRALVINRFTGDGIEIATNGNNIVEGCYLGLNLTGATDLGNTLNGIFITNSPNNVIGGIFSTQRNFISGNNGAGIQIGGLFATNNQVLGNVIGLNVTNNPVANSGGGVRLNASFNFIGGGASGARNVISGNSGNGIEILGATNKSNQVLGNYIGADLTGMLDRGNSGDGVFINNSGGHQIGGTSPGEGNLISGNNNDGIEINGLSATNTLVRGNLIGTDFSGTVAIANDLQGVFITSNSRSNVVGGVAAGAANTIAFNAQDGIQVAAANANTNNAFRGNAIFSNGDLGIDLGNTGVQTNDNGDPDSGANSLQNFPVLSAATNGGSSVTIVGSLNSTPNTQFALDFFANVLFDTSGNGQGQFYLGSTNVTTGADSNVNFTVTLPVGLTGRYVSATATDPFGNTSEFSTNVVARSTVANNTFTVINTNDNGAGSLRAAISNANQSITVGPDLINFAIPGLGPHTIAPSNALPAVADMVIIDGYTQSGAVSNTLAVGNNALLKIQLDGINAPNNVPGLSLWGGNSTVRGLGITRFKSGSGHGVEVFSTNNFIVGNFIGVGLDGATDLGNGGDGVFISGVGNNVVGGTTPAVRNVISGNTGDGIEMSGGGALSNVVQGNYIGTDANGARGVADLGNSAGVNLNGAPFNIIGGNTVLTRNVIADNASAGVATSGNTGTNNVIQGNIIGTDVNGAPLGNNSHGISIASSSNTIGGTGAGEANSIAYNNGDGVFVTSGTNNLIRANAIFDNGGVTVGNQGIDLGSNGIQPNDPGDPDGGANQLQNFPVLTNAVANVANTQIQGTLNSRSNTTYQIDFYSNVTGDPSGSGEGHKWLGSATVITDGTSNAVINATVSGVAFGRYITATATDPFGNTSEFSTNVVAGSTIPPTTFTVINTNDSGPGSLRAAISNANAYASSGNDLIVFNISGAGPHVIALTSALPALTDPATIDGYTQPGAQTNTVADGNNAVLKIQLSGTNAPNNVDGLRLEANGCVVRGLAIVGFKGTGDGIEAVSAGNLIEGCFIGLDVSGTNVVANANNGILISGVASNTIGGSTTGARNVISGNTGDGIELFGVGASNNIVAGNFIGSDAGGTLDKGNGQDGVFLSDAPGNLIGGSTAAARNVISGNSSEGITFQGNGATNNQVLNNYIGADVTGTNALANASHGVLFTSQFPRGNVIGSPNPGGNIIAFNGQDGVFVQNGTNNAIRANNIFSNGGLTVGNLGIDLGSSGVLANDFPDLATGANLQQNYPELTSATANPANTQIQGTLRSRTNTTYQLDFFSSLVTDPSGNGEGQKWLGSTNVTTDANGSNIFNVAVSGVVLGRFITATATDPFGNTSEFSPALRASSTIPPLTFTVINTNNSGFGSLRDAILLNNNTVSGTNNLIEFDIPGTGTQMISPLSNFPVPTEAVTIDGYTQTGASENTLTNGNNAVLKIRLDGASAGFGADGLQLTAIGGNIVRGLSITRFGDGIELGTNGNNRIEGNFIGLDVNGVTNGNNGSYGVHVNNSPGNLIGGTTPAARNVISRNNLNGVYLTGAGSTQNRVEGNFIGTDFSGTLARGNSQPGILIDNASTNTIGGTNAVARNVISGNDNHGVSLSGTSQGNLIQGNFIGTDVTGNAALGNFSDGVNISVSTGGNAVGGTNSGARNLIAFNSSRGVTVSSGTNNPIRANNIFSNGALGIDLTFDFGVTANDAGDPDTGANQIQNFPIISAATITPANTTIQGDLNSRPNTTYQIDFFANVFRDASGNGEGQQYLGSTNVTTAANSNASFNATLPVVAVGRQITATATDPFGNTSEFSPAFAALSTFPPMTFVVTNTLNQGPGSLLQAIQSNNASASGSNNIISFNLAGAGPHAIAPTNPLPVISEPVTIDGFTQPGASTNSLADGNNAVLKIVLIGTNAGFTTYGLRFSSSGNVVRGLDIVAFSNGGIELATTGNVVEGCVIGLRLDSSQQANLGHGITITGPGNRVGGTTAGARNVISGNSGDGIIINTPSASNNVVQGNFIGTDISGTLDRGNNFAGIEVFSTGTLIGGNAAGAGNVLSGNTGSGVGVGLPANNTTIKGNRIGLAVTDAFPSVGNNFAGVTLLSGITVIGGTTATERNVISANGTIGIQTASSATNVTIVGNYIGTDATGTLDRGNGGHGIGVNASGARVGGGAAGEGNLIAFNASSGVAVGFGTNSPIRANRIFANNLLGIDIGFFGVTSNDVADVDGGPNNLQNFPELTNAVANVGNTLVQGRLNSQAGTVFQLDFFVNQTTDPSGHGEGQFFLGSTNVTTDGSGNASFSATVAALLPGARRLTATATDPSGNTSEFSPWISAGSTIPPATFTVLNTNDSGAGSLRQTLLDVGLFPSAGNDTIAFAISGSGVRTIAPLTVLPTPQDPVTIDGFTQTNSSVNTLTNGNNAVIVIRIDGTNLPFGSDGLELTSGNNIIRGLEIARFQGIGIDLNAGNSNLVSGSLIWSNSSGGVSSGGGSGNRIGGLTPAARNVISANGGFGVELQANTNSVVQGNFIGTDFNGTAALGGGNGVFVNGGSNNLIGLPGGGGGAAASGKGGDTGGAPTRGGRFFGNPATMRNVISGNGGAGILFGVTAGVPVGNRIFGNLIGTDVTGTFGVTNQFTGITVNGAVGTTIGGTNENEPNLIAFNLSDGVQVVQNNATNNNIQVNSIYDNAGLGIDLQGINGVNNNDAGDPDSGPNQLQNFPLLTSANITTSNLIVQGTLNSRPSLTYRVDFFANVECDPTGNGEGKHWLGSTTVTTGADSNAAFNVNLPFPPEGQLITATASDPFGNTSEYCLCRQYGSLIPPMTYVVTNVNDSGPGSLRKAIEDSNATFNSGPNELRFNIAGAGVKTIAPLSPLPDITRPLSIDGFTQPGASPATNGNNAIWLIRIDCSNAGTNNSDDGLYFINTSSNVVRGLCIVNTPGDGIEIEGGGGSVIEENLIGIDVLDLAAGPGFKGTAAFGSEGRTPRGMMTFIRRDCLDLQNARDTLVLRNFLGNSLRNGINIRGLNASNNCLLDNIVGMTPPGGWAPITLNGARPNNAFGTKILGGGIYYTGGSAVSSPQFNLTTTVDIMSFGWIGGKLLHDRVGDGIVVNSTTIPIPLFTARTSAGQTTIQGSFFGAPNTSFTLIFYAKTNGHYYKLTERTEMTGPSGLGTINFVTTGLKEGDFVRATADSSATGSLRTSEDSPDQVVMAAGTPGNSDLGITKTDSADPVIVGTNFTYTITVTNGGPLAATNIVVRDFFPSSLFVIPPLTTTHGQFYAPPPSVYIPVLTNGEVATITFTVNSFVFTNVFSNAVTVASAMTDPNTANNNDSELTTVISPPSGTDLQITKSGPFTNRINEPFYYFIYVTNLGPTTATGVRITDTLPPGFSLLFAPGGEGVPVTVTNGTVIFDLGTMASGQFNIVICDGVFTNAGTFTNSAVVSSTSSDSNPANNTSVFVTTVTVINSTVQYTTNTFTVLEGNTAQLIVTRSGDLSGVVTVPVLIGGGTARSPDDYPAGLRINVQFNPGETQKVVMLPTVPDTVPEDDENVIVTLANPIGPARLGVPSVASLIIQNNDGPIVAPPFITVKLINGMVTVLYGDSMYSDPGGSGKAYVQYSMALPGSFMTLPGAGNPFPLGLESPGSDFVYYLTDFAGNKTFFRLISAGSVTTGSITGQVRDKDGHPIPGAFVRIGDGTPATATDANGNYLLTGAPAGVVPLSFGRVVTVSNEVTGELQFVDSRVIMDVNVRAGMQEVVDAIVEIPAELGKPVCNCVPWANIAAGTVSGTGTNLVQTVFANGGKLGICAEAAQVVITGPGGVNITNPTRRVTIRPAASGVWTISSTVCGRTTTRSLTLP